MNKLKEVLLLLFLVVMGISLSTWFLGVAVMLVKYMWGLCQ